MKQLLLDLETMYLDYYNNYVTVQKFADDYNIDYKTAMKIIELGKIINNSKN